MSSPRVEALAYRIWAYAEPMGWNVTTRDIADEIGISSPTVGAICRRKGWIIRLRSNRQMMDDIHTMAIRDGDAYLDMDDQFGITALSV